MPRASSSRAIPSRGLRAFTHRRRIGQLDLQSFVRLALGTGADDPQRRSEVRDSFTVGIITVVLAIALGLVSPDFRLDYFIDEAGAWFALTGTTIAVGLFGGYAAIVAVYLGIAAFTPRREQPAATEGEASPSVPSATDEESV